MSEHYFKNQIKKESRLSGIDNCNMKQFTLKHYGNYLVVFKNLGLITNIAHAQFCESAAASSATPFNSYMPSLGNNMIIIMFLRNTYSLYLSGYNEYDL